MLIMDSVYRQQLIILGLDPETFPIAETDRADGWGATATFETNFAKVPVGLWSDFSVITNVGVTLGSTTKSMTNSQVNTGSTKSTNTNIQSTTKMAVEIRSGAGNATLLTTTTGLGVQTKAFDSNIASDKGTALASSTSSFKLGVTSNTGNNIESTVKTTKLAAGSSIHTTTSQVKEYTVAVVSN